MGLSLGSAERRHADRRRRRASARSVPSAIRAYRRGLRQHGTDIVFYEGPDRGIGSDAEDTIRTRGESGFARFLASQGHAEARSLEPSPGEQMGMLLAAHPLDQVNLDGVGTKSSLWQEECAGICGV